MSIDKIQAQLELLQQESRETKSNFQNNQTTLYKELEILKEKQLKVVNHPLVSNNKQLQQEINSINSNILELRKTIDNLENKKRYIANNIFNNQIKICKETGGHIMIGGYCITCGLDTTD